MALYRYDVPSDDPYSFPAERLTNNLVFIGGCVRLAPRPQGCYIHTNNAHHNYGLLACWVAESTGDLYIDTENGAIVTMDTAADETISGIKGIVCGPSSGTSLTVVKFYDTKDGRKLNLANNADYDKLASTGSNVWVSQVQSVRIES